MSQAKQSLDLSALEQDYEIVGELTGQSDVRTFAATRKIAGTKRRDDNTSVLISIFTKPDGDEGNALSHLAADVKLLTGNAHRRLIPIVEGRWLGELFAVVTERTSDASLAQKLETGERFSTTRTAAILRELSGLLEWAREHNVIHRAITGNRIFLEPKTDRVRVAFGVSPIPRIQRVDGPTEDARTVVRLALAMLTGRENPAEYGGKSLAELRPDLPSQLRDATADMLDEAKPRTLADVTRYISLIGMAEPLGVGEHEASRIRAETLGEQLEEREKLFNERVDFDRAMKEERANFEKLMADQRANFEMVMVEEKARFAKEMEDARAAHAQQKAELQDAVTAERAALAAQRESLERAVAEQRAELERAAADDRARIEALRAEIKRAGELELERKRDAALTEITDEESALDSVDFAPPLFVTPVLGALDELRFDDENALMREDDVVEEAQEEVVVAEAAPIVAGREPMQQGGDPALVATEKPSNRRKWLVPGALAALALFISATAIAIRYRGTSNPAPPAVAAAPAPRQAPAPAAIVPAVPLPPTVSIVDSSAGRLASREGVPDSVAAPPRPRPRPRPVVQPRRVVDSAVVDDVIFRDASPVRRDSMIVRPITPRRDSLTRRDSITRPDTIPR